jgi:hypothetical protein
MQSLNNLKQIGLAVHNYESAEGRFPAANYSRTGSGLFSTLYSPVTDILPYVEQDNVAKRWQKNLSSSDTTGADGDGWSNATLANQRIKLFVAPAMPVPTPAPGVGWSSYAFSAGNRRLVSATGSATGGALYTPYNGAIVPRIDGAVTMASFTDGTSNTLLAGEMFRTLKGKTYTSGPLAGQPRAGYTIWASGHPFFSWGSTNTRMNAVEDPADMPASTPPERWAERAWWSFRSSHQGVHFALADGSCRFIRDSLDTRPGLPYDAPNHSGAVFQALGSRNGGEVVSFD